MKKLSAVLAVAVIIGAVGCSNEEETTPPPPAKAYEVWVAGTDNSIPPSGVPTLVKLQPSGSVVGTVPLATAPGDITECGGYLYTNVNNNLYEIDPVTGSVLASYDVQDPNGTDRYDGIGTMNDELRLLHRGTKSVYRLTTTGSVTSSYPIFGQTPLGLAGYAGSVWYYDYADRKVFKVRDADGKYLSAFYYGPYPQGLGFDGQYLWGYDGANRTVIKINPASAETVSSFPFPSPNFDVSGLTVYIKP